ncbi:Serine carboxypeptidase [Ceratobasidium sp. AG-Ba]|nr:Serine carboxypeptidase [Ceratobasidium sp. AG-Ba]
MYIPYIVSRILDASPSKKEALPLNLQSWLMIDGVYSSFIVSEEVPIAAFAKKNQQILGLNNTVVQELQSMTQSCRYQKILDAATYPPRGEIPLPNGNQDVTEESCDAYGLFQQASIEGDLCFNAYRITDECPTPPVNRADVQKALHFDNFGNWTQCSCKPVFATNEDGSGYSETLFPDLLSRLPKGFSLWHGLLDAKLLSEGTRITIQNLTWAGHQGFQKPIKTPWTVNGTKHGLYHTERKLTYIEFDNAGHMIPQDQPEAALHVFKWVLNGGTL